MCVIRHILVKGPSKLHAFHLFHGGYLHIAARKYCAQVRAEVEPVEQVSCFQHWSAWFALQQLLFAYVVRLPQTCHNQLLAGLVGLHLYSLRTFGQALGGLGALGSLGMGFEAAWGLWVIGQVGLYNC